MKVTAIPTKPDVKADNFCKRVSVGRDLRAIHIQPSGMRGNARCFSAIESPRARPAGKGLSSSRKNGLKRIRSSARDAAVESHPFLARVVATNRASSKFPKMIGTLMAKFMTNGLPVGTYAMEYMAARNSAHGGAYPMPPTTPTRLGEL